MDSLRPNSAREEVGTQGLLSGWCLARSEERADLVLLPGVFRVFVVLASVSAGEVDEEAHKSDGCGDEEEIEKVANVQRARARCLPHRPKIYQGDNAAGREN